MGKIQSLGQYRAVATNTSVRTAKVTKILKSGNSILSHLWDFASSVTALSFKNALNFQYV